mmetsp:Transcript_72780/g.152023  ORF Transcript_72780/g.152023 Transcript_72780/m.152023 type:complete len:220 (-) Transcript_72780:123-782(-)
MQVGHLAAALTLCPLIVADVRQLFPFAMQDRFQAVRPHFLPLLCSLLEQLPEQHQVVHQDLPLIVHILPECSAHMQPPTVRSNCHGQVSRTEKRLAEMVPSLTHVLWLRHSRAHRVGSCLLEGEHSLAAQVLPRFRRVLGVERRCFERPPALLAPHDEVERDRRERELPDCGDVVHQRLCEQLLVVVLHSSVPCITEEEIQCVDALAVPGFRRIKERLF